MGYGVYYRGSDTTVVFYPRRRGVLVTGTWFYAHGRRFAIGDLAGACWCSGSMQATRWAALKFIVVETALVITGLAVGSVASGQSWLAVAIGGVNLLVAGIAAWLSAWHWPTPLELWADHREAPTLLYTSSDHTEFHKVCRALMRAMELNDETAL
jgi:hypothetical protein